MTRQVRVSLFADRLLEVDDAEYADLKAQNLIVDEPKPHTHEHKSEPDSEPKHEIRGAKASDNKEGQ